MADISAAIMRYMNEVLPLSKDDIAKSVKSREWFLDRIQHEIDSRVGEPDLYPDPFIYFGSYFKGTKVADVDEFDILVVIDSNSGKYSQNNAVIGAGLGKAKPNNKYNQSYMKSDNSGVSSNKMVLWLKDVVDSIIASYDGVKSDSDGIGVKVRLISKDVKIDLIPCGIFDHVETGRRFYNISNGRDSWTLTSPREDIDRIKSVAKGKDELKNVIRLCKRVRDQYNFDVSSFAIETSIVNNAEINIGEQWARRSIHQNLNSCLHNLIGDLEQSKILDPIDNSSNLLKDSTQLDSAVKAYSSIINILNMNFTAYSQNELYNILNGVLEANLQPEV